MIKCFLEKRKKKNKLCAGKVWDCAHLAEKFWSKIRVFVPPAFSSDAIPPACAMLRARNDWERSRVSRSKVLISANDLSKSRHVKECQKVCHANEKRAKERAKPRRHASSFALSSGFDPCIKHFDKYLIYIAESQSTDTIQWLRKLQFFHIKFYIINRNVCKLTLN